MSEKKDSTRKKITALGLLVTLGIVFGDIGTSPLYVMKAICHVDTTHDPDFIIGAVSCIFWTLTLLTTVKYVIIALRADNKGEGGILALYSIVRKSKAKWLYIIAALGASTLVADGVITPAMTVTSAIEGLSAVMPNPPVIPLTILIITLIFVAQPFGTSAIGRLFGPAMLLWFLMLGILGALNIGLHPAIMKALNPWYAVKMLFEYPGWIFVLGAVFLCTTGAEALYSDLGHCGRWNISASWIFVKVMLIINYMGQGAWIISHPGAVTGDVNPFYAIMPGWFVGIGIAMSTLAAIIASQALISGSFTIVSEAVNLNFWPRLKIKYPTTERGQLYIPAVNIFLYAGCIITVLLFKSSSAMEGAYGLAITVTMIMTTVLIAFWLRRHGAPLWAAWAFFAVFTIVEGSFLVANAFKFMHGGWYTMLIAFLLCGMILIWYRARRIRRRYVEYADITDELETIAAISADREIPKYSSNLIFISRSDCPCMIESKILYSIIRKHPMRADHYWLVRIETTDEPDTLEYTADCLIPGVMWSLGLKLGFRVDTKINVYFRHILEDLVAAGELDLRSSYPSLRKKGITGDFRFYMIHRKFSPSSNCSGFHRWVMTLYEKIHHIQLDPVSALGLDTSSAVVETVPLIIDSREKETRIKRARD